MLFTSYTFLFLFLPLVVLAHHFAPTRLRNPVLLLASYVFYAWWRVDFALLLVASAVIDYTCGRRIHTAPDPAGKRRFLLLSVVTNLSLLGYFKYANWGVDNLNGLLELLGGSAIPWAEVVLPVGISFFTFQTMSYSIDVYRGDAEPASSLLDFSTYVAMFPQLVAGPIVRYRSVAAELAERQRDPALFTRGTLMFMVGFSKKILLANNCGLVADAVFDPGPTGFVAAWIGLAAYTFQIYFDFSGYSDMAIGLGNMFGFHYPRNFDSPYRAQSITDFWRRWHITLTTWIRDYLYIPLGGNRDGKRKTYRNLAAAMVLCGLWHGASWTFALWGAYHAALLISERVRGREPIYAALPGPVRVACTMVLVMLGWLIFRSETLEGFSAYAWTLADPRTADLSSFGYQLVQPLTYVVLGTCALITYLGTESVAMVSAARPRTYALFFLLFGWSTVELLSQEYNPFLYFQF
ncbi:MAG: MBOAT family O-acyltransferase [Nannocystales bacterium]